VPESANGKAGPGLAETGQHSAGKSGSERQAVKHFGLPQFGRAVNRLRRQTQSLLQAYLQAECGTEQDQVSAGHPEPAGSHCPDHPLVQKHLGDC